MSEDIWPETISSIGISEAGSREGGGLPSGALEYADVTEKVPSDSSEGEETLLRPMR